MTTVGLELTSFIDPRLTWKTVSKGRNTSRRSRRSAAKNMKMVQEHEKRSPKRLNSLQCSESDKSNAMIHGQRFAGNMEHIPIKKRRLFFRSPSPPLQSPNRQEESEGLVGGQCTSDENTCSDGTTVNQVLETSFSNGSKFKISDFDGKIDEQFAKSSKAAHGSSEDFSGIAILAAAACSDRLDNSTIDSGKGQSQLGGLLDKEQNESFSSTSDMKESNTSVQSPVLLGKDIEQVEGVCMAELSKDSLQVVSVNKDADDAGMSPINEPQKAEQSTSSTSTSINKESVECLGMPDSLKSDVGHVNKESVGDLQDEVADKTSENSGSTRDFRLHWDLNTVMDEWGHPLDDPGSFDPTAQVVEVTPMNIVDSRNMEDVEGSDAKRSEIQNVEDVEGLQAKKFEAIESGNRVASQAEVCARPASVMLPDNSGFTSVYPAFSKKGHCSEVLSGFVTSILKEKSSSNVIDHVLNTSVCITDPKLVNKDAKIDHSVSLGLNSTNVLAPGETNDRAGSENPSEVAEEVSRSALQIVKSEEHEIGFSLASFSNNAISELKHADCKHIEDLEARNVLNENDNKVTNVICQPTAPKLLGECENAESGQVSCEVNDLNCKNAESPEQITLVDCEAKHEEVIGRSLESQPFGSGDSIAHLKESSISFCSRKLEDIAATSITMDNEQLADRVIAKEIEEKPTVTDASESDLRYDYESGAFVPKLLDHCVAVDRCSKPTNGHLAEKSLGGGPSSLVSNQDSSQVTENAGTVIGLEGGYDSHLEDGELRESHCWEDNEGEDRETEHVDYDSDNRDGIVFFEAANDSVQLPGEFLVGDCEKPGYCSDNFISADDQPNPAKSIEENCSIRFQGCLSTVDESSTLKACVGVGTSTLKACSGVNISDKVEMDHKNCRSSIEADSIGKDFENDPPRNASGASASGRDLQFADRRYADSMRRSRSSNFDCMHHTDGPNDSLTRTQQPSLQMGRFGGRSWNPELKSVVANSASEDDGERLLRGSGDTSPLRGRRRIISTSRSGYHFVRRGSPGDRDSDYGMGMMKVRDISPDNNSRSRFGRFDGMNRGFREGFRRPGIYEGPKSGGGGPIVNRFNRRERSFSPAGNRFHRKSRSRSRTRSPDFRSEARMGRCRVPYQQANHAAEHTRERRSPVRLFNQNQRFEAIGSPGRLRSTTSGRGHDFEEGEDYRRKLFMRNRRRSRSRSRSCSAEFRPDAKMGSMRVPYQPPADHIRDRRSPVRVFRPDQRYEGGGSPPVRLRSDEGLRPMMRPLRFPDAAQSGRGHEYNNNNNNRDEYRRKPRNIFKRIHPIRHYDVEGDVRRFQYDDEDAGPTQNFRRNENYVRPGERRPVEFRGPREERGGNVRYNNSERMFYSGPKQYGGMPEFSEDGGPRRVRP